MDDGTGDALGWLLAASDRAQTHFARLTQQNARAIADLARAAARLAVRAGRDGPGWPPAANDALAAPASKHGSR
jgi:hypothetical protein